MKVITLLGSPRNRGNSKTVAERIEQAAGEKGAEVETYTLNKLNYRGCQACYTCKKKLEKCVLNDDLTEALQKVKDCDVLIMASPIYFGEISSQLKGFVDRTFSYLKPDYTSNPEPSRVAPGKKLIFITTQGSPDPALYTDVFPRYEKYFTKLYGFSKAIHVRGLGVYSIGDAEKNNDLMEAASNAAHEVIR